MTINNHSIFKYLEAFDNTSNTLNAIIETPKGSRNKYKYNEKYGLFMLHSVLPLGSIFPFDFGYIPSTLGQDGDPLDILVIMDQESFTGCYVPSRLIGVIEAEQTEGGKRERNDRLIAVAQPSQDHRDIHSLDQLEQTMVKEIEHFFVSYENMRGKQFKVIARRGPEHAKQLVHEAMATFKQKHASS